MAWPNLAIPQFGAWSLPAGVDSLAQAMLFAAIWLLMSLIFLVVTGRETGRAKGSGRRYGLTVVTLSAGLYGWITGSWILAVGWALGALLITAFVARFTPDLNSRGHAHLAAFGTASALLVAPVVKALFIIAPSPLTLVPAAVILLLDLLIGLISVGFAFDPLNVVCRRRWRRHFPPILFPTGYYPKVSIHVPAHSEPTDLVIDTLRSLVRLDYPNYEIIMVDDNTAEPELWQPVMDFCHIHGIRTYHLWAYPGFKSGALNFAMGQSAPDVQIIAVVDSDYQVEPNYLRETVGYFQDPRVAFVQTPQAFRDVDTSFLQRVDLSQQYWFDVGMRSRNERNSIIFCGTMGLIRRSALERIGGWGEWCVTEDAEASLRMLSEGLHSVFVHKVYGRGLLPVTFDDLRKQRFRWALGGVQILRRYWPRLLPFVPFRRRDRLTLPQRLDYLLGGLGWFADLLVLLFSLLLLATTAGFFLSVGATVGVGTTVNDLYVAALMLPLAVIASGVLRSIWTIKITSRRPWVTSAGAFFTWLSLSLTVARACYHGLRYEKAAFLRTPKHGDPPAAPGALKSLGSELLLGGALCITMVIVLTKSNSFPAALFGALLAWQTSVFWSSAWNALGAYHGRSLPWKTAAAAGILFLIAPYLLWFTLVAMR